jgi:hypothetical protein
MQCDDSGITSLQVMARLELAIQIGKSRGWMPGSRPGMALRAISPKNPLMAFVPQIFDRSLARRRLARAFAAGCEDFLLPRAAGDIAERLSTINREFRAVLDIGTPSPRLASLLAERLTPPLLVRSAPPAMRSICRLRPSALTLLSPHWLCSHSMMFQARSFKSGEPSNPMGSL